MITIKGGSTFEELEEVVRVLSPQTLLERLMNRAPYNTTFDAWRGPTSTAGPPGVRYRIASPCRKVPQTEIQQNEFPNSLSSFWMTYDAPSLNVAQQAFQVGGIYSYDFNAADRISIPTGTAPQWVAVRSETITPTFFPAYRRVLLSTAAFAAQAALVAPVAPGANCLAAPAISLGVLQNFIINPGAAQYWYRLPGVLANTIYFVHSNHAIITGFAPTFRSGATCATSVVNASVLLFPGTYKVQIAQTGDLWINFPASLVGPMPCTLCVDTYPYRP